MLSATYDNSTLMLIGFWRGIQEFPASSNLMLFSMRNRNAFFSHISFCTLKRTFALLILQLWRGPCVFRGSFFLSSGDSKVTLRIHSLPLTLLCTLLRIHDDLSHRYGSVRLRNTLPLF